MLAIVVAVVIEVNVGVFLAKNIFKHVLVYNRVYACLLYTCVQVWADALHIVR